MIGESRGYKSHLAAMATKIERWHAAPRWTDERVAALEKEIFIAFFLIRKLIESSKLTEEVVEAPVRLSVFKPTGIRVDRMSRHDYWELYDMKSPREESRELTFICHQIVHSYVFAMSGTVARTDVIFSSDRHRRRCAPLRTTRRSRPRAGAGSPRTACRPSD